MIGAKVWVLEISHRHGTNVTVHASEKGANDALLAYVDQWWDQEFDHGMEKPADPQKRIESYFDGVEDECANIYPAQIEE